MGGLEDELKNKTNLSQRLVEVEAELGNILSTSGWMANGLMGIAMNPMWLVVLATRPQCGIVVDSSVVC